MIQMKMKAKVKLFHFFLCSWWHSLVLFMFEESDYTALSRLRRTFASSAPHKVFVGTEKVNHARKFSTSTCTRPCR